MTLKSEPVEVQVGLTTDPQGRPGVLLQLPYGWIVVKPAGAREVAAMLLEAADDVDHQEEEK